jgi:hypothetical protein
MPLGDSFGCNRQVISPARYFSREADQKVTSPRGKILILDQVQKFVNDSSRRLLILEVRSNGQESFLCQVELLSSFPILD